MIISSSATIQKTINFDGNSFLVGQVKTWAQTTYSGITGLGYKYNYHNFAVIGKSTAELIVDFPTKVQPYVKPGQLLVFNEITNDFDDGLSAAQAYTNVQTYCAMVRALGLKIIVCTMCAADYAGAPADIETKRTTINANIRANWSTFCDGISDMGSKPEFDSQADCTNLTYYSSDKLHPTMTGYGLLGSYLLTDLQNSGLL